MEKEMVWHTLSQGSPDKEVNKTDENPYTHVINMMLTDIKNDKNHSNSGKNRY